MIPELGQFALALALTLAVFQFSIPLYGAMKGNRQWMGFARPAAQAQALLVAFAFGCLVYAFVTDDFRCSTWRRTRTPRCRSNTASPAPGVGTRARCSCGR